METLEDLVQMARIEPKSKRKAQNQGVRSGQMVVMNGIMQSLRHRNGRRITTIQRIYPIQWFQTSMILGISMAMISQGRSGTELSAARATLWDSFR
jgi:hypothetical protein